MENVEVEGSTIDEAIGRALQKLGVERERVEIEIISDASRGLFGLGGRKARVRATLRAPINFEPEKSPDEVPTPTEETAVLEPANKTAAQKRSGRDVRRKPASEKTPAADAKPASRPQRPQTPVDGEVLENARGILGEIVRHMGVDASVEISENDDEKSLSLKGDASGILIGRRGQTLDALEYLINRIAVRGEEGTARIGVDSENYRIRHRRSLEDLAQRMAEQARRRNKAVTLNAMSPRDRRIVHLSLQGDPSLTTRSTGSGFYRKLLIIPAGGGRQRSKDRSRTVAKAPAEPAEGG